MLTLAYAGYSLVLTLLAAWAFVLFARRPSISSFTVALPIALLVWDNAVVALGALIGPGSLLEALSWPRFLGHALFTPIWIVTGFEYARRAGVPRLQGNASRIAEWTLYAVMAVLGLVRSVVLLEMVIERQAELVYYTNGGGFPGPPIPALVMVVVVIATGYVVGKRTGWWWMLVGGLVMFVAAAVPTSIVGFWLSNTGEVVLSLALVATERFMQRSVDDVPSAPPAAA